MKFKTIVLSIGLLLGVQPLFAKNADVWNFNKVTKLPKTSKYSPNYTPPSILDRFDVYLSGDLVLGEAKISNISSAAVTTGSATVDPMNSFSINSKKIGLMAAVGKKIIDKGWLLKGELQYQYQPEVSSGVNPAFPDPPVGIPAIPSSFHTSVRAYSIFANVILQSVAMEKFSAYALLGIGSSHNIADSTMTITSAPLPPADSLRGTTSSLAWHAAIGGRYQYSKGLAFKMALMHSNLGNISYGTFYQRPPSIAGRTVGSDKLILNSLNLGIEV